VSGGCYFLVKDMSAGSGSRQPPNPGVILGDLSPEGSGAQRCSCGQYPCASRKVLRMLGMTPARTRDFFEFSHIQNLVLLRRS
jgi:hypothetical protein